MSRFGRRRRRCCWRSIVGAALLASAGCLPRGPISLNWPWRHGAADCPADGDEMSVCAPHSAFHPVPTGSVFTPWMDDDSHAANGTVAAHRPSAKSLDERETPPSDSELANRRSEVRSAAARSAIPSATSRSAASPSADDDYYNPTNESAGGAQSIPSGSPTGQWRGTPSGS